MGKSRIHEFLVELLVGSSAFIQQNSEVWDGSIVPLS